MYFLGKDTVACFYSDNDPAMISACQELGINREGSEPFMHETNGIIESFNAQFNAGVRGLLCEAGFPTKFWPLAGACWTFLTNVKQKAREGYPFEEGTRWAARHGEEFKGLFVPFGALVQYIPPAERIATAKADPTMRYGVFVGYRLKPGAYWKGEYLVLDISFLLTRICP